MDLPVLEQPFGHVSFVDRAVDYLADVNNELRLETQLNEKEWPKGGTPDPESYLTKTRREGVLLYYATDGVVRTLPKGVVPMFDGLFGINPDRLPPFPYRAVWYSVLDADEEFADWLSGYARKCNWANVSYLSLIHI